MTWASPGPKLGCGEGACGACTVLIGRRAVTSCTTPAAEAAGQRITTVEGLAEDGVLHPVQQAWLEHGRDAVRVLHPGLAHRHRRPAEPGDPAGRRQDRGRAGRERLPVLHLPADHAGDPPRGRAHGGARAARAGAAGGGTGAGQPPRRAPRPCPGTRRPRTRPRSSSCSTTAWSRSSPAKPPPAGPGQWGGPDDAWVHVGADGSVTAFTGKVEARPGHPHRARPAGRRGARGAAGIGAGGHGQHRCLAL